MEGGHRGDAGGVSGTGVDEMMLVGPDDGLDTVAQSQLAQDAANMRFHGSLGQEKLVCNFGIGGAGCDRKQHVALALSKRSQWIGAV